MASSVDVPAHGFDITADQLKDLVNFDERNNKDHIAKLNAPEIGGISGLAAKLKTDLIRGLPRDNSAPKSYPDRRAAFGENVIPPPPSLTIPGIIWDTIKGDRILQILILGAIVILAIGTAVHPEDGWIDGIAILVAVVIVLTVTATNDYTKDQKFRKLLLLQSEKRVKVVRNGERDEISSWDVQVGDLVELTVGDEVPADGLLTTAERLILDESPLTGESLPVRKTPSSPLIFSGCQVSEGSGLMLVTTVGERSTGGQIQVLLNQQQKEQTALQLKLAGLGVQVGYIGLVGGIITFLGLAIRFAVTLSSELKETETPFEAEMLLPLLEYFVIGVTVVVVAIPEGLPLAVTISLGFSMFKMIRDRCFVRHLNASETMGQASCICTDKTGTLTENRMTVVRALFHDKELSSASFTGAAVADNEASRRILFEGIAINSTCFIKRIEGEKLPKFIGSATEGALLIFGEKLGCNYEQLRASVQTLDVCAFSSDRKRMSTVCQSEEGLRLHCKGASEIVLARCSRLLKPDGATPELTSAERADISTQITEWASEGLRTIVLAYRPLDTYPAALSASSSSSNEVSSSEEDPPLAGASVADLETELVFLAMVGIEDPLRPEVPEAVRQCQTAGLVIRMVTGDNIMTACKIARECGILTVHGRAMEGPAFRQLTIEQKKEILPSLQVLARSSPADKYELVEALKEMGEIVAVTGDGTNDAPALKLADVGFAMGQSGTQIAMNASDIVLLDDNFASLVRSIAWGRNVLDCVRKFLQFQLAVNFAAVVLTFVGSVATGDPPLSAVQLLWVNLIMDSLGALALASDEPTPDILHHPPHARNGRLVNNNMILFITSVFVYELTVLLVVLFSAYAIVDPTADLRRRETYIFTIFVLQQLFNMLMTRQLEQQVNPFPTTFRNWLFWLLIALIAAVQAIVVQFGGDFVRTVPLNATEWALCIVAAVALVPWVLFIRCCRWLLFKLRPDLAPSESEEHHLAEIQSSPQIASQTSLLSDAEGGGAAAAASRTTRARALWSKLRVVTAMLHLYSNVTSPNYTLNGPNKSFIEDVKKFRY